MREGEGQRGKGAKEAQRHKQDDDEQRGRVVGTCKGACLPLDQDLGDLYDPQEEDAEGEQQLTVFTLCGLWSADRYLSWLRQDASSPVRVANNLGCKQQEPT